VGGARHDRMRNGRGSVVVQTALQGRRYHVFSTSDPEAAQTYRSVSSVE